MKVKSGPETPTLPFSPQKFSMIASFLRCLLMDFDKQGVSLSSWDLGNLEEAKNWDKSR